MNICGAWSKEVMAENSISRAFIIFIFNSYFCGDQKKKDVMGGHVACMRETINSDRVLVKKPKGNRPFSKPQCRWNNIKVDI